MSALRSRRFVFCIKNYPQHIVTVTKIIVVSSISKNWAAHLSQRYIDMNGLSYIHVHLLQSDGF